MTANICSDKNTKSNLKQDTYVVHTNINVTEFGDTDDLC